MVGGFHTTGNFLTWVMYYLAIYPHMQEKVRLAVLYWIYSGFHPVCRKILKMRFWGIPRLVGRYCSYLLPMQALWTCREEP